MNPLVRSCALLVCIALSVVLAGCGGSGAGPGTPPPPSPPVVTSSPANQAVNLGQTATFSVSATGSAPLAYQWRRNATAIAGAAAATYTTPSTVIGDHGVTFDVVVSNAAGSVTSSAATLTVLTPAPVIAISMQPAGTSVNTGDAASFSVSATCAGGTLSYQWQRMPQGGTFADVAGEVAATLTTAAAQASDNSSQYRVVLRCGTVEHLSDAAVLTVTSPPAPSVVRLSVLPVGLQVAARPDLMMGIAREPSGSYLFLDAWGLRRLSADLTAVTTVVRLAGSVAEAVDGPVATARLYRPTGLAIDADGNAYITDTGARTIRRFGVNGILATIAGSPGMDGGADGTGAAARFHAPLGIALGPDGDLYVVDDQTIRRITPGGVVTTYAGSSAGFLDGSPFMARFGNPRDIAAAANGDVYVTDLANHRVRRIVRSGTSAGSVETLAGSGAAVFADGVGTAAGIASPSRIAISASTLYVSDYDARVRAIDLGTRAVTTIAGAPISFPRIAVKDGTGTAATFDNLSGGYALMPDGTLLVADRRQFRAVSPTGVTRTIGILSSAASNTDQPPDGLLTDQVHFHITSTRAVAVVGDGAGSAWIGDGYAWIRRVTETGVVSHWAGQPGGECCVDGNGIEVQFGQVFSLARDATGTLHVGDSFAVRRVLPSGVTSFIAGDYRNFGAADGLGGAARFNNLNGMAIDSAGNIYVADANAAIRKIDTTGNVTTLAGAMGQLGTADGVGASARFMQLRQMALGPDEALHVCDGDRLRRVTLGGSVTTATVAIACNSPVFDTDGALYYVAQGQGGNGGDGFYRLRAGGTPERLLQVQPGPSDLASSPQVLGTVMAMGSLAPKVLVIVAGTQVLKAELP
jgi:hypothetical protein